MAKKILLQLDELPKTRAEALETGSQHYFTGKPCKHGHIAARDRGGNCMECHLIRELARYQVDPEPTKQRAIERYLELKATDPEGLRTKIREDMRAWRAANPERALANSRAYEATNRPRRRAQHRALYAADPEKHRAKTRAYLLANPGYSTEQYRRWAAENPEKARVNEHNKRAREKNAEGRHTAADIAILRDRQGNCCAICSADLAITGYHIDHIVPLARGGTNWPENLQLTCPSCNLRKWANVP